MTRSPLGVGVVGLGFGQYVHVPAFRSDPRCRVVAIAGRAGAVVRPAAARLGIPRSYADWRQLVDDPDVHVVAVAVPPSAQPAIVMAAAERGKHVFCEKPVAGDVASARAMLDVVERAGITHAVDFIFPEVDEWKAARTALETTALGPLRAAAVSWRVETLAHREGRESWKVRVEEGGGTLNNFVSHTLYYLEWLFGPVTRLAARLRPAAPAADVGVDGWLEFASGLPVTVSVAADAFLGSGHRVEVYGERGTLALVNESADYARGFRLAIGTRAEDRLVPASAPRPAESDGRVAAAGAIVARLIDGILTGAPVRPGLADGMRVQHLLAAMRTAAESETWQQV